MTIDETVFVVLVDDTVCDSCVVAFSPVSCFAAVVAEVGVVGATTDVTVVESREIVRSVVVVVVVAVGMSRYAFHTVANAP